ncbi:MAG: ribosome small subunit-dependent GTPase A [Gammaproteobacteria bacterium]|nr:ribosome small subunit-dependent GTPase A [Gammaproteobacteria bacterium]
MKLEELGWSHFFQQQILSLEEDCVPARICRQDVNQYLLLSENGVLTGKLPGRLRREAFSKADLPTVGDWVLVKQIVGGEQGTVQIEKLLERRSRFSRQEAGDIVDEQVIAANIDTVFIVSGLDEDFNISRIERYLLLSRDSGALPVILLNKSDVCDTLDQYLDALRPIARGTPFHVISAKGQTGLEDVRQYISSGTTCALMGSSGVGKSTVINALLGYDRFETGSVREADGTGRHTTTFREMVEIPSGGLIIDTPGMRELQVWGDASSLAQSFEDIEDLALNCKFGDCKHDTEPGCAIASAITAGELDSERLESYRKFDRELLHLKSQQSAAARAEKKEGRKRLAKHIKNRADKRD